MCFYIKSSASYTPIVGVLKIAFSGKEQYGKRNTLFFNSPNCLGLAKVVREIFIKRYIVALLFLSLILAAVFLLPVLPGE